MKKQIMICFNNEKWICDYIHLKEAETEKEAIDTYMNEYQNICDNSSIDIVSKLLPSIVHISVMGE